MATDPKHCCEKCGRKILLPSMFHDQRLCALCCASAKKEKKSNITAQKPIKVRQITETRSACKACGNIWFYGKSDSLEQAGNAMSNCGKSTMCCTCSPLFMLVPNKKVTDLNKCPKCGSRAIIKEKVIHDV